MKGIKSVRLLTALLMTGIISCTEQATNIVPEANTRQIEQASFPQATVTAAPVAAVPVIPKVDNAKISSTILSNKTEDISEPLSSG
jgi:hypothetical protein